MKSRVKTIISGIIIGISAYSFCLADRGDFIYLVKYIVKGKEKKKVLEFIDKEKPEDYAHYFILDYFEFAKKKNIKKPLERLVSFIGEKNFYKIMNVKPAYDHLCWEVYNLKNELNLLSEDEIRNQYIIDLCKKFREAIENKRKNILDELLSGLGDEEAGKFIEGNEDILRIAIDTDDRDIVKSLLDKAPQFIKDKGIWYLAVMHHKANIVSLLLDMLKDETAEFITEFITEFVTQPKEGSILLWAERKGTQDIVNMLREVLQL